MPGPGSSRSLWLKWSWRDLRHRWISVLVIAIIIAVGTGVYAGLGSTSTWRRLSNDASFAQLHLHDLRIEVSPGSDAAEGDLIELVRGIPHADSVTAVQERLRLPTQVDASSADEVVLVSGELVGADLADTDAVDALFVDVGTVTPDGLLLEHKFARHFDLPAQGRITLAGGTVVAYSGQGVGPEEFLVSGADAGGFLAEGNYAVVYGALATIQQLTGRDGRVNDAVMTIAPGSDLDAIRTELEAAIASTTGLSATVTDRSDVDAHRLLYDDIDADQEIWNVLSILVLGAAAIAAFNLVSRIVEAQRRELGIQMALGVPPVRLALRPLLVAAQIALLGALFGVGFGLLVGSAMRSMLVDLVPLPLWRTPFQTGVYLRGAALGFVVPFAATLFPVWRAVRVEPIEAIRTTHLSGRGAGLASAMSRLRLPGDSVRQLPLRNVVRTPRRTVLTAVGVGAAVAVTVAVLGMLDSFVATIDRGEAELLQDHPDRLLVTLDGFQPTQTGTVPALLEDPTVGMGEPTLELPATLLAPAPDDGTEDVEVLLTILDLASPVWHPTVRDAVETSARPGIVLAEKAASDLGVEPGDVVVVRHPRRVGPTGYELVETEFVLSGRHPSPLRPLAFVDTRDIAVFGLAGVANSLQLLPAEGSSPGSVQRALFTSDGVAGVQPVTATSELFDEALDQFVGFLYVTEAATLLLALLIAFNTTSISVDERAREHATLFAFGLRVRTVTWLIVQESFLMGLAATAVGIGLGYVLVHWMVNSLVADTVPEFGFLLHLAPQTYLVAAAIGVLAVGLAPLLLARRLVRMDIPDALRVME